MYRDFKNYPSPEAIHLCYFTIEGKNWIVRSTLDDHFPAV
jgi:hypothetical protein